MKVILEGPDGAGKTTLLDALRKTFWNNAVHKSEAGPPEDKETFVARLVKVNEDLFMSGQYADFGFMDRHPIISEYIYGNVLRGSSMVKLSQVETLVDRDVLIVVVLPEQHTYLEQPVEEGKDHKSEEHMSSVHENRPELWRQYSDLCSYHDLYRYDRTEPFAYESLVATLEHLLRREKSLCVVS